MKIKSLVLAFFLLVVASGYSQRYEHSSGFSTLSGTIRIGFPIFPWGVASVAIMGVANLVQEGFLLEDFTISNWMKGNHNFFRFFNMGYDYLVPQWSVASPNNEIELIRPYRHYTDLGGNSYIYYVGYYLNWRSQFTRFGFYCGIDYEWRTFMLSYPPNQYRLPMLSEIQSLLPACGVRYRLIDPMKEIDGFLFNIVLEAGITYAYVIKYENDEKYDIDALNNGFKSLIGVSITTNKFGSIHVRWSKDLYQVFNRNYKATYGILRDYEITNNFGCISIGYATFL